MVIEFILNGHLLLYTVKPLFKSRRLISADGLVVAFIWLTNRDKKSVIWELFYLGDNLAAHQDFSIQPKEPATEALF